MTKKIKFLLVLNVALLAGIAMSLSSVDQGSTGSLNNIQFRLADTVAIQKITINDAELVNNSKDWVLNNEFTVNPDKLKTLLAVMLRLEVKRPVSPKLKDSVFQTIQSNGLEVKVFSNDAVYQQYKLISNEHESYMVSSEEPDNPYIVYVPGYFINLQNLYTIKTSEWRDTRILRTNWLSLRKFSVDYSGDAKNSFQISISDRFFKVSGVQKLDSANIYSYISQLETVQAEKFVENPDELREKLKASSPFCTIQIEDSDKSKNKTVEISETRNLCFYVIANKMSVYTLSLPDNCIANFSSSLRMLCNYHMTLAAHSLLSESLNGEIHKCVGELKDT